MSFEVSWRKVRGELPGWCAGDAGMVPLSARETAKGEEQATQLAASTFLLFFQLFLCLFLRLALPSGGLPGWCA